MSEDLARANMQLQAEVERLKAQLADLRANPQMPPGCVLFVPDGEPRNPRVGEYAYDMDNFYKCDVQCEMSYQIYRRIDGPAPWPNPQWLEKMAQGEDACISVAAGSTDELAKHISETVARRLQLPEMPATGAFDHLCNVDDALMQHIHQRDAQLAAADKLAEACEGPIADWVLWKIKEIRDKLLALRKR